MNQTAEDTIHEQDKKKRLQDEAEILEMATRLTNGDAENPKMMGEVLLWQVKESISHSTLLRILISNMGLYQLKTECELCQKPKTWMVRIFGVTYAAPVTTAIVCISFFVFLFCKKQGWV